MNIPYTLKYLDEGVGFDTSSLNLEKDYTSLNSIKSRGWGLFILKKLCDDVHNNFGTPERH